MRALTCLLLVTPLAVSAIKRIPDWDDSALLRRGVPIIEPHEPPPVPKTGPDEPNTSEPNTGDPSGGTSGGPLGGPSGGSSGGKGGGTIGADPPESPVLDTGGVYKQPEVVNHDGTSSQSTPNQGVDGTATQTNRDFCGLDKEACTEMINNAVDMIKEILENVGGSSTSATSTTTSTSTSTSMMQNPGPTNGPLLNANMSSWMDLRRYHEQLTSDEFNMLNDSPVCFFANMEALYQSYANQGNSTPPTSTSSSSSPPSAATTTNPNPRAHRFLLLRTPQEASSSCSQDSSPLGTNPCASSSSSSSLSSSSLSAATDLYARYLPSQISMVYLSTPTSLSVTATSTTSCSGLGENAKPFETTYGLFGFREGYAPSSTAGAATSATGGMVTGAAAGSVDRSWLLSAGVAVVVGLVYCT
ncbi:MAG: hypothetical protein Q9160_008435 [Pyrenula sp. 1 TL-2023]